jgi:hypothetical protein
MSWRYLPDLPNDVPDNWKVCDGFHADRNGIYRTGFMAATSGYDPSTSLDNYMTGRVYAPAGGSSGPQVILSKPGTTPVWNINNGSTWNDRAGTAGNVFFPEGIRQWGNITLVADSVAVRSRDATGTSNFATVAGSPAANALFITPLNILVAVTLSATVSGSDAWNASDANDYTNWATGQAASGNLRQTPGILRAGVTYGNDVLLLKDRGIMRGTYVGLTNLKWQWSLVPGSEAYGAWGPGCAVAVDGGIYFVGDGGFCYFDGVKITELDAGIRSTLTSTVYYPGTGFGTDYRYTRLVYDSINRRICFFNFGSFVPGATTYTNTGTQAKHFTYQVDSGLWGYQSRVKDETDGSDAYTGVVLDGYLLNSVASTGEWTNNTNILLISKTNDYVAALITEFTSANSGTNYKPKLRTHRLGNRLAMSSLIGVVPNWTTSDGAGTDLTGATVKTITPYASDALIEAETAQTAVTMSTGPIPRRLHQDFSLALGGNPDQLRGVH